jgi:hypothetical protein
VEEDDEVGMAVSGRVEARTVSAIRFTVRLPVTCQFLARLVGLQIISHFISFPQSHQSSTLGSPRRVIFTTNIAVSEPIKRHFQHISVFLEMVSPVRASQITRFRGV